MQFVTGLPDLPKTEAKGVILVRGPWDETPSSPGLPFDVNHSMFFSRCVQVTGLNCCCNFRMPNLCTHVSLSWVVYVGRIRRSKLVHWVERASFERIRRLLEIFEQERHHEVFLTKKNLHDLSHRPSPYSVPIIPRPLPSEIVEGEQFVTKDLLNLIPGSSSPAREAKSEVADRELAVRIQPRQPFFASEDSGLAPRASRQVEGGNHLERPPLARKGSRPTS